MTARSARPGTQMGRRRGQVLEHAVREAVLLELGEVGYAAATMEGIARRAGTGKGPLYRRWSTKSDLVLDTLRHLHATEHDDPVDTGDLRTDLIELLATLAAAMAQPTGRGVHRLILELVLDRGRYPDLATAAIDAVLRPRVAAIMDALARAVQRAQIQPQAVSELVAKTGPALIVQHQQEHDGAPSRDDIAAIVDRILMPALHTPSR